MQRVQRRQLNLPRMRRKSQLRVLRRRVRNLPRTVKPALQPELRRLRGCAERPLNDRRVWTLPRADRPSRSLTSAASGATANRSAERNSTTAEYATGRGAWESQGTYSARRRGRRAATARERRTETPSSTSAAIVSTTWAETKIRTTHPGRHHPSIKRLLSTCTTKPRRRFGLSIQPPDLGRTQIAD